LTAVHEDIAAALQLRTEEICKELADFLYDKTKLKNLSLAGGVCLNSVMNAVVFKNSKFKNIFIPGPAGDTGAAIGAAYYVYHKILGNPRKYVLKTCFLGTEYDDEEILSQIKSYGVKYSYPSDIVKTTAKLLADGHIVGWFQGKMEIGPRALGNRSILADPRRADMKDILNSKIKHREGFRPFAPSVLEEESSKYFELPYPSPFMLLVSNVRPDKRAEIPAVTHVDGTGRYQTVNEKENKLFYALIKEFGSLTGCPVLINTSFNVRGEPIVESPAQAIECLIKTELDYLVLGNYLIAKSDNRSKD